MRIFDVGFYDGSDTDYYLRLGAEVVAFEANAALARAGARRFADAIAKGRLQLLECGVGSDEGTIDFFLHKRNAEWSTFYRDAAVNWGEGACEIVPVPCITPRTMFARHGVPDYLKVDVEGYDIYLAQELKQLPHKPPLCSFEASNRTLLRELLLAGYDSFKLVDQGRVPQQVAEVDGQRFRFTRACTGQFGDAAPGEWLSFENAMYLYLRFEGDLFATSLPKGSWWDVHAAIGRQADMGTQLAHMRRFIEAEYGGHCGLCGPHKPKCPASASGWRRWFGR